MTSATGKSAKMESKIEKVLSVPSATRKEKHRKLRRLHFSTVNDPITRCTEATRTTYKAKEIVSQMQKELTELSPMAAPNSSLLTSQELEAIKISSGTFSKIISDCFMFKEDLMTIKRFYDNRLDELLRSMNEFDSKLLRPSSTDSNPVSLEALRGKLIQLKKEITHQNEENKRLKNEWACHSQDSVPPITSSSGEGTKGTLASFGSRVESTHCKIFAKRKEMSDSFQSRVGLVPVSVCQRLEQCIRSSELEIQKLSKINRKLQREIQSLETRLKQYLEAVHTSPNQLSMLWKTFEHKAERYVDTEQSPLPLDYTQNDCKKGISIK